MHRQKENIAFVSVLTAIALALCVRSLCGFCWSDESFYLTFAQRLWNGQKLILDEWHPVQFYSALTFPILTVYRFFFGTTGIYLFARIFYLLLAYGVSLLVYFTFRAQAKLLPSFLCACMVLAYSRGNIWGLSYYNLFLLLTLTAFCLWVRGNKKWQLLLCGVSLGFSVLCVPYFAVFVLAALAYGMIKKETRGKSLWVFAGICLAAAYFLIFFLPKDLGAVLTNLRFILSDPEHAGGPMENLTLAIKDVKFLYYWEAGAVAISAVVLLIGWKFLPKKWGLLPGLILALAGAAVSVWRYRYGEIGFAAYSFALFCLPPMGLMWLEKKQERFSVGLRLTGIAMGLAMALSSNTEAVAFLVGVFVYSMGVMTALWRAPEKSIRRFALVLSCCLAVISTGKRFTDVFRDAPLRQLDTVMTQGPAAGIRTTQDHARQYTEVLGMLEDLESRYGSDTPIFISKLLPWGYLAVDNPCGAPTAWRTALDSLRLEQYYESHPQSIPGIVVVLSPEIGYYDTELTPNENCLDGWLWDYMAEEGYACREYSCAQVYVSPAAIGKE